MEESIVLAQEPHNDLVFDSLSVEQLINQVSTIKSVMNQVMTSGVHYDVIKGCGDKPTLLQPGAQMLALTFGFSPKFTIKETKLDKGHREYFVVCDLVNRVNGNFVGQGVGAASTRENKWLYTTGPLELTDTPVPREYWDIRHSDKERAQQLLGGQGHIAKKNDAGQWVIAIRGEKVETDNPDDKINTVLKMATKRAFVHAVLNTTAASELFTQDIEDDGTSKNAWKDEVLPQIIELINGSKLSASAKAKKINELDSLDEETARKFLIELQQKAEKAAE